MEKRTFLMLLDKYLAGKATPEEERLLEEYYRRLDKSSQLDLSPEEETALQQMIFRNIWEQIGDESKVVPMRPRRLWPRIAAAASIILVLSAGGYFALHKSQISDLRSQISKNDIAPGSNTATLTLSDGRKIILSDAKNGTIASQGQTLINKTADGKLVYAGNSPSGTGSGELAAVYNTLETKRGEQYQLTLPDGSKVWLNAASSLRYPVAFSAKDRTVELTGEAYFEVVHNAARPFKVKTAGQTIQDIGTQFDVNAYADEPAEMTALIEGAVQVSLPSPLGEGPGVRLKPGQAAIGGITPKIGGINSNKIGEITNNRIGVISIDPQTVTAWKNGEFRADNETLEEILKQAARWYDVDIRYENEVLKRQRFGVIGNRYANISGLLHDLELTQKVKFQIQNRTIYVSNPN